MGGELDRGEGGGIGLVVGAELGKGEGGGFGWLVGAEEGAEPVVGLLVGAERNFISSSLTFCSFSPRSWEPNGRSVTY